LSAKPVGYPSSAVMVRARTADGGAMEQKGLRSGHFLALVGALAAFASLWRPWYEITIPQQLRDALSGQLGQDPGLLGEMARGIATALPSSISASGWKELQGADAAVAVGAVVVIALVLGAGGAFGSAVRIDSAAAARGIAAVGALGVVLALVHVVNRPGSGPGSDYIHIAQGLWIALVGCVAVVAGGLWASVDTGGAGAASRSSSTPLPTSFPPLEPELPPVFATPSPSAAAASVPPPGA
jgi:hypothetical protein